MRWSWRIALLAVLALQAASTIRMSIYGWEFHRARMDYRAERYRDALRGFERARTVRAADPLVWNWIGDAADAAYRNPPAAGWSFSEGKLFLATQWAAYAGGVLRSPYDSWTWRGLAETALRDAERKDLEAGVDLAELDRRSAGLLDARRGLALVAAKIALELKPSGFEELDVLTRVYTSAGQLDDARGALIRSARMMPAPSFHVWGDGEHLVKPLYDGIMAAMREGLRRAPAFEHCTFHLDIARFARDQGDLETALDEMDAAVRTAPDVDARYLAYRGKAEVLEAMGRFDAAVAAWDSVIETGGASDVDRRQRGLVLHRAHRDKEACRDLRESVRDDATNRDLRILASGVCEEGGDRDTAERLIKDGFVLPIDDLDLARKLLDLYLRNGKRSSAEGLLRVWIRDHPDHPEIRRWHEEIANGSP